MFEEFDRTEVTGQRVNGRKVCAKIFDWEGFVESFRER